MLYCLRQRSADGKTDKSAWQVEPGEMMVALCPAIYGYKKSEIRCNETQNPINTSNQSSPQNLPQHRSCTNFPAQSPIKECLPTQLAAKFVPFPQHFTIVHLPLADCEPQRYTISSKLFTTSSIYQYEPRPKLQQSHARLHILHSRSN